MHRARLQDFQSAITAAAGYYEAYYQVGMAYVSLGKREDAETSFRKSIELSGDKYCEADVGLGTLMLDRLDFAQGEKTLRRGVELNPDYWLGQYELGRALLNQDKLAEALKSADQAKSLAPSAAIVYRLLSNIHLRQKDYPALLADIDSYVKLDPDSAAGIRAKQLRAKWRRRWIRQKRRPRRKKLPDGAGTRRHQQRKVGSSGENSARGGFRNELRNFDQAKTQHEHRMRRHAAPAS